MLSGKSDQPTFQDGEAMATVFGKGMARATPKRGVPAHQVPTDGELRANGVGGRYGYRARKEGEIARQ